MLARMDEDAVVILFGMFALAGLITWISLRAKNRSERLKVMEKAIQSGHLDDQMRRKLLEVLSDRDRTDYSWLTGLNQHLLFLSRNLVFIGGWIAMFVGIGMCISAFAFGHRYMAEGGVITALVGFALATVPLALRELNGARSQAREPRR